MYDIIEQFKVRAEDGTVYDAMVKQDIVGVTATDDKRIESIPGLKEIVLADGRHMNRSTTIRF
jgi:hypothetical protein